MREERWDMCRLTKIRAGAGSGAAGGSGNAFASPDNSAGDGLARKSCKSLVPWWAQAI